MNRNYLYKKIGIPVNFWNLDITPSFRTIKKLNIAALTQAEVYNSLLNTPEQLINFPRRWTLGVYSTPAEHAVMVLAEMAKRQVVKGMRVAFVKVSDLPKINAVDIDFVFCYNLYSDSPVELFTLLRNSFFEEYSVFYAIEGTYEANLTSIKITPDFAFNVESSILKASTAKVI